MKFSYVIISVKKYNNIILQNRDTNVRKLADYEVDGRDFIPDWVRDWSLRHHAQPDSGILPHSYQMHSEDSLPVTNAARALS
jgi:hypothetical protein